MKKILSKSLKENVALLQSEMRTQDNFDVIYKAIEMGKRNAGIFFVDGFIKDANMQKLLEFLYKLRPEEMPDTIEKARETVIAYIESDIVKDTDTAIENILRGMTCLFVEGYEGCICIDCRTYPARNVAEPSRDKTMRGSKDSFVETITFNTALIRRRIRSTDLTMKMMSAGKTSKTDIVLCYMKNRVDPKLLNVLVTRIERIQVDALTMNQESLAECIYEKKWYNPFPKFKFTERPDASAAAILEGNIVVLVDNSPFAMVIPTSIFDIIEEADDYYFPPITGTYLRLTRFLIAIITLLMTPIFLVLTQNPQYIPEWLAFIQIKDPINIPILAQFLILELTIDGLRLASVNTPSMLSTPLSVMAGLILGQFTVDSGWFNSEIMLYMAFVAIANYTQSSYELGYALKFMRIIILILTAAFNVWGFFAGVLLTVLAICTNRTVAGKSYIYPLFPFNLKQVKKRFFRMRLKE